MQMKGPGTIAAGAAAALVVATGALLPRAHAHNPLDTVHLPDVDSNEQTSQHTRSLSQTAARKVTRHLPTLPGPAEDNGRGFRRTTPQTAPTQEPAPAPTPGTQPKHAPRSKQSGRPGARPGV